EKPAARAQRAFERPIEPGIARRALEQLRKRGIVSQWEITGIPGAEHADVSRNARREHWCADAGGLGDDGGAAFHHRAHDEHMALCHPGERAAMSHAAEPAIA